jgi:RNase adaptor protein for sRNA GlmZ degradation
VDIFHDAAPAPGTGVMITTFGYLHGAPPEGAHITLDLRRHFRDPHVAPELRYLTARDAAVRTAVLTTPGIQALIDATAAQVVAYLSGPSAGPSAGPVTIAVGCAGGRHRAAVVGMRLAAALIKRGFPTRLIHRDLDKAVVNR